VVRKGASIHDGDVVEIFLRATELVVALVWSGSESSRLTDRDRIISELL
jgi:hypothetical protein